MFYSPVKWDIVSIFFKTTIITSHNSDPLISFSIHQVLIYLHRLGI